MQLCCIIEEKIKIFGNSVAITMHSCLGAVIVKSSQNIAREDIIIAAPRFSD